MIIDAYLRCIIALTIIVVEWIWIDWINCEFEFLAAKSAAEAVEDDLNALFVLLIVFWFRLLSV